MIRRLKYNLNWYYKSCDLTEYEAEQYQIAADGQIDGNEDDKAIAARLHDLQRVADGSHIQLDDDSVYSRESFLISVLKECLDRGEGALVYTEYEDTYKMLGDLIKRYRGYLRVIIKLPLILTGKIPYKKKGCCRERSFEPKTLLY